MFFKQDKTQYLDVLYSIGLPVGNNDFWWVRYPQRGVNELFDMKENTNARFIISGRQLIWEEEIMNNFGTRFLFTIETDSKYPFSQPRAYIINPKIDRNFNKHIYKDKSLCLMHPDSYNSKMSIIEIRNLTSAWCFCYEAYLNTGKWPAAEHKH